jgi:DNA (cytosine-5)-methyltransferase 1
LKSNNKPKVVSLFSGCGGLDLGFIKAGYDVIWANDFDKDAVTTYKKNIGNEIYLGDITKISDEAVPNDFDVLIGGFPCQGFSVANNKRSMNDSRNFLYLELLRVLKTKKPSFFLAENVKGLLSMQKGKVLELIINDFKDLGYNVDYKLIKASDFGIPQNRERLIIIGNRLGLPNLFPKVTHSEYSNLLFPSLEKHVSVQEAIGFLNDVRLRDEPFLLNGRVIHNHVARTNVHEKFWGRKYSVNQFEVCDYLKYWRNKKGLSTQKIDKHFGYRHTAGHWFRKDNNSGSIPKPDDWWELKKLLGFDDKFDKLVTEFEEKKISFEQSLRISNWDKPSDTITATGPEIHPNKLRRLSVRECAILQTFPDDFIFTGSLGSMYSQIGNAVPVKLAELLALEIKNVFSGTKIIVNEPRRVNKDRTIRV